ncbi:hypothetical protein IWZ03DRAFT_417082 [Phyllosticta citriasiana]|uniref:AMP-dependent synthetase/ligase domain-containing protein n=1 Tax=Phyllosticta citriasiana TaxID=595635 RepID=A0ABR1KIU1_9PEZI
MSPACIDVAVKAADAAGFGRDNVFLVEGKIDGFATLQELVEVGKDYGNDGQVEVFKIPLGKKNSDICGYLSFSSEPDHKRVFGVLPSFHIMGLVHILHLPLIINAEVLFLPDFSLQSTLSTIAEYRISELLLMPPIIMLLARNPALLAQYDLSCVKKRFPGSGFKQGYGLTESTGCNTAHPPHLADLAHAHTVGTILAGTEVKIVRSVEDDAADDKRDDDNGVGVGIDWPASCVAVLDRIKEMIQVKGTAVAPAELEDLLHGHARVDDVAVMGVPPVADDDYAGEPPLGVCRFEAGD